MCIPKLMFIRCSYNCLQVYVFSFITLYNIYIYIIIIMCIPKLMFIRCSYNCLQGYGIVFGGRKISASCIAMCSVNYFILLQAQCKNQ